MLPCPGASAWPLGGPCHRRIRSPCASSWSCCRPRAQPTPAVKPSPPVSGHGGGLHRLLQPVVPPEETVADGDGGDSLDAQLERLAGGRTELVLDGFRLDSLQDGGRMELAGGSRKEDVVDVAHVPARGEDLSEAGEGERDDPAR